MGGGKKGGEALEDRKSPVQPPQRSLYGKGKGPRRNREHLVRSRRPLGVFLHLQSQIRPALKDL